MAGYIGTKYRQRRRRRIFIILLLIIILLFIYYSSYIENREKTTTAIESLENTISSEEYELSNFEKDQAASYKDKQINSLTKKNIVLTETIDFLNSKIEKNLNNVKNIAKKEIEFAKKETKETNVKNLKLQEELKELNSSIFQLKKEYKTVIDQNLELNLEIKKYKEEILQYEQLIIKQSKIIEEFNKIINELKDKTHH